MTLFSKSEFNFKKKSIGSGDSRKPQPVYADFFIHPSSSTNRPTNMKHIHNNIVIRLVHLLNEKSLHSLSPLLAANRKTRSSIEPRASNCNAEYLDPWREYNIINPSFLHRRVPNSNSGNQIAHSAAWDHEIMRSKRRMDEAYIYIYTFCGWLINTLITITGICPSTHCPRTGCLADRHCDIICANVWMALSMYSYMKACLNHMWVYLRNVGRSRGRLLMNDRICDRWPVQRLC